MGNEERTSILQMVAAGTITPAEADDLLSAIDGPASARTAVAPQPPVVARRGTRRNLVIRITERGESKVNLRIPLGLARVAGRFIPRQAHVYLNSHEVNIAQLLDSLDTEDDGTLLEVNDVESQVLIAVE